MKVKDLIKELELFNGEQEVCRADSERGDQKIKKVKEAVAVCPDITYVVIE
jgi:hypothetical protein